MYQNRITKTNPGLLVIVIDQSEVMSEPMPSGNKTLADITADAINQLIAFIDDFYSHIDGYGDVVSDILAIRFLMVGHGNGEAYIIQQEWNDDGCCGGGVHEVSPVAKGMQSMSSAFNLVKEEVAFWTKMYSGLYDVVPLIINVTASGNISNDISMRTIIKDIMGIQMPDGNPIMYNVHLVFKNEAPIIYFPNEEAQLPDAFSKLMYDSSSVINIDLRNRVPNFFSKHSLNDHSRLFLFNYNVANPTSSLFELFDFAVEYFCAHRPGYRNKDCHIYV